LDSIIIVITISVKYIGSHGKFAICGIETYLFNNFFLTRKGYSLTNVSLLKQ